MGRLGVAGDRGGSRGCRTIERELYRTDSGRAAWGRVGAEIAVGHVGSDKRRHSLERATTI